MDMTELLARMWIECDPNRGGPNMGPDDIEASEDEDGNVTRSGPRWRWFVPRAEATQAYLKERGFEIVRV